MNKRHLHTRVVTFLATNNWSPLHGVVEIVNSFHSLLRTPDPFWSSRNVSSYDWWWSIVICLIWMFFSIRGSYYVVYFLIKKKFLLFIKLSQYLQKRWLYPSEIFSVNSTLYPPAAEMFHFDNAHNIRLPLTFDAILSKIIHDLQNWWP